MNLDLINLQMNKCKVFSLKENKETNNKTTVCTVAPCIPACWSNCLPYNKVKAKGLQQCSRLVTQSLRLHGSRHPRAHLPPLGWTNEVPIRQVRLWLHTEQEEWLCLFFYLWKNLAEAGAGIHFTLWERQKKERKSQLFQGGVRACSALVSERRLQNWMELIKRFKMKLESEWHQRASDYHNYFTAAHKERCAHQGR